jgi:hypothetical protein
VHREAREGGRPAAPGDARDAAEGAPTDPVDVVGQVDRPCARRGQAEGAPERVEVALDRGPEQVEALDPREGALGQREAPEAVAVGDPELVDPGHQVEGARHQVAGDRAVRRRREQERQPVRVVGTR